MTGEHLKAVDPPPGPTDPLIGTTVDGRYLIQGILGVGGMGVVYKATHAVLNKPLAVKVLKPEVSRDQEIMTRFRQEAQSASAIGNHHIIDISDFGTLPDGSTYFVMEMLDGRDLTAVVEDDQPIPASRVVFIAKQLCDALGAAHQAGIVHRDLKPDNIFVVKRGDNVDFVKVLDFGIAKVGGASSKLTKAGQVFGTPHYMSPEQCSGSQVDQRTDIYALGVILYEMACGRVPFDADNLMGILTKHMYEQPLPPHTLPPPVNVPSGLEAVILKALEKKAEHRYQTMAEVKADLEALEVGATPGAVMDQMERSSDSVRQMTGPAFDPSTGQYAPGTGQYGPGTGQYGPAIGTGMHVELGGPQPAPQSRLPLVLMVLAVVLVLVVSAGAGAYYAVVIAPGQPAAEGPTAEPETPEGQGAGPETGESTETQETPETPEGAGGGFAATPPAALTTIESEPSGAEVYEGEVFLGNTPYAVERPVDGQRQLTVRQPGFAERSVEVSARSGDALHLTLAPERRRGRRGRRGRDTAEETTEAGGEQQQQQEQQQSGGGGIGSTEVIDPWNRQ